jgi:hypothetical protein
MDTVSNSTAKFGLHLISHMSVGVPTIQLIQASGINNETTYSWCI